LSLRAVLLFDAATCAAMGGALTLARWPLGGWTGLPPGLLLGAGLALLAIAALIAAIAARTPVRPGGAWLVILGNAAWVAGSLALLAPKILAPNALGVAFVAVQAIAVAAIALAEFALLRRAGQQPQPA